MVSSAAAVIWVAAMVVVGALSAAILRRVQSMKALWKRTLVSMCGWVISLVSFEDGELVGIFCVFESVDSGGAHKGVYFVFSDSQDAAGGAVGGDFAFFDPAAQGGLADSYPG